MEAIWEGRQLSICCVERHRWQRWPNLAIPPPAATIALAWVLLLLVKGPKSFGWEQEGGEKKCPW